MIQQVMVQGRKTAEFLALYSRLLEKDLTPIVVKGIICREMYREPDYRASGDEDVLIPPEQFTLCDQVFRENAMDYLEPEKDPEKEGEVPYYKKGGLLHIELHKELFPAQSEAYGELNEMFRDVFQRKIQTEIQKNESLSNTVDIIKKKINNLCIFCTLNYIRTSNCITILFKNI